MIWEIGADWLGDAVLRKAGRSDILYIHTGTLRGGRWGQAVSHQRLQRLVENEGRRIPCDVSRAVDESIIYYCLSHLHFFFLYKITSVYKIYQIVSEISSHHPIKLKRNIIRALTLSLMSTDAVTDVAGLKWMHGSHHNN